MMKLLCIIFVMLCVAVVLPDTGCDNFSTPYERTCDVARRPSMAARELEAYLCMTGLPVLGKELKVNFIFSLTKEWREGYLKWHGDAETMAQDNVKAGIELPRGFELVSGDTEWEGSLKWGEERRMEILLRPVEIGRWEIKAYAGYPPIPGETDWRGVICHLYTGVFTHLGLVSEEPLVFEGHPGGLLLPAGESVMTMDLSLSRPPALGETAEVTLVTTAIRDAPGAYIYISMHSQKWGGFELVSGDLRWEGDLTKGMQVKLQATVKAVKTGIWPIFAYGYCDCADDANDLVCGDNIEVYVFKNSADVVYPEIRRLPNMEVGLDLSGTPALNQTAKLTCTIVALSQDVAKAEARVDLRGFELVSGDLKWQGSLTKDVPIQIGATIKAIDLGGCEISARAEYFDDVSGCYVHAPGGEDHLYLNISENTTD